MELRTVGVCGPYPQSASGCSAHVLRSPHAAILLDLGSGSLGDCLEGMQGKTPDCVILTHNHFDHIGDMFVYAYYLESRQQSVDVYLCDDDLTLMELFRRFSCFHIHPFPAAKPLCVGDMQLTFVKTYHSVPNHSVCVQCAGEKFVYSSDTRVCSELKTLLKGCDLALINVGAANEETAKQQAHMCVADAFSLASQAGVGYIVFSHFSPALDYASQITPPMRQKTNWCFAKKGDVFKISGKKGKTI